MRCIVLGATGYLGSKVVGALVAQGNDVLCICRSTSSLDRLESIKDRVRFCQLQKLAQTLALEEPYDCMVNLACKYPRNAKADIDIYEANLFNPLTVFTICRDKGVRKFVTIGTGLPDTLNAYAMSKAKLGELLHWYVIQSRLQGNPISVCNVKLENFYGEDEPVDRFLPGTVARLKRNETISLTAGTQVRDFVYVSDVLDNLVAIIHRQDLPEYLELPLGSGEGVSIKDLVHYLKKML